MGFLDADPIEEHLSVNVTHAGPEALMDYCRTWVGVVFGIELSRSTYVKDHAIVKKFCKDYGNDAGLILKCLFVRHNGLYRNKEHFQFKHLSQYQRDWHDELLQEARSVIARDEQRAIESQKQEETSGKKYDTSGRKMGFMTAEEFLNAF